MSCLKFCSFDLNEFFVHVPVYVLALNLNVTFFYHLKHAGTFMMQLTSSMPNMCKAHTFGFVPNEVHELKIICIATSFRFVCCFIRYIFHSCSVLNTVI